MEEPPNNNFSIPEIPPHLAVEAGSIQPLSEFTNQLRIKDAFFEAVPEYPEEGNWHFIEFELNAAQTRAAFTKDAARGGEFSLKDDFRQCLQQYDIDYFTETYVGDSIGENQVVILPDPIPFRWLQTFVDGGGALKLFILQKVIDATPAFYNANANTNAFGPTTLLPIYAILVQDGQSTAKMYVSWNEDGDRSIPEELIEEMFDTFVGDIRRCLKPGFSRQNKETIRKRAETVRRRQMALALSGRRSKNQKQLPSSVVREVVSLIGPSTRRKSRKQQRRCARKSRRFNRK